MKLTLCTKFGQVTSIDVDPSDTWLQVKKRVKEFTGVSRCQQMLFVQGERIHKDDNQALASIPLKDGDVIHVTWSCVGFEGMEMPFMLPSGKSMMLNTGYKTFEQLKEQLEMTEGIPASNIQFYLDGKEVDYEKRPEEYGIDEDSKTPIQIVAVDGKQTTGW